MSLKMEKVSRAARLGRVRSPQMDRRPDLLTDRPTAQALVPRSFDRSLDPFRSRIADRITSLIKPNPLNGRPPARQTLAILPVYVCDATRSMLCSQSIPRMYVKRIPYSYQSRLNCHVQAGNRSGKRPLSVAALPGNYPQSHLTHGPTGPHSAGTIQK